LDKVRLQELDTENATLRAQVDKLMQRVHQLPPSQSEHATNTTSASSTGSSAVASSDLHALQTRLAGVKEQLGAFHEYLYKLSANSHQILARSGHRAIGVAAKERSETTRRDQLCAEVRSDMCM
jgi:hypothetical protein